MKIAINAANKSKIESALRAANGRATKRTYTSFADVEAVAARAEKFLADRLAATNRAGAICTSESGGRLSSSYNNVADQTRVTIQRGGHGWYLIDVCRAKLFPGTPAREKMALTKKQDEIYIKTMRANYVVQLGE